MSSLRKCLKRPTAALAMLLLGFLWAAFDVSRDPRRQLSARAYLWGVQAYQQLGRPLLEGRVQCRYDPSCSEYSREAVRQFGIVRGLALTARRISRCRSGVPLGTNDPLPSVELSSGSG